ncbi:MAG TPA: ABC-F family ATP-binding cassette domain-containing protein [Acidimicrobiales bacterium]|nr:ABC-F family ATP-binding cassette domain-containing protein [Acidimicrobiales bacterium]
MGALEVSRLGFTFPGGGTLFGDVSFRVGDGQHVALVGANGAGKTTLVRLIAGDEQGHTGTITVDGRLGVMRQFIGSVRDTTTVRDLLVGLSPPPIRAAASRLSDAETANLADASTASGLRYAEALTSWGDIGGYDAEVLWDTCTTVALRAHLDSVGDRPLGTLSGGEQKRLALELLLRSDDDVLLLDEPDNYLDVPGKEWLTAQLHSSKKTVLFVSHDRQLLSDLAHRVVAIEAKGAWTHGGSFATWAEARQARLARLDEDHRRWREERKRMEDQVRELRRQLTMSDAAASRLRATQSKIRRHDAAAPPERPKDQSVVMRLGGDRTGKRAVVVDGLSFPGLVSPFETEVLFGERIGVLGLNGTGKTHFLRLLSGAPDVVCSGSWSLGARVAPGYFSQTHEHPELVGRRLVDVLQDHGLGLGPSMAALRRYELSGAAQQPFETLSGGQQARLQILLLELTGATLLLLDEPTDNLDVASAEALEDALSTFTGTVLAVTHDRWFMRSFDRFLVFRRNGSVVESLEPVFA